MVTKALRRVLIFLEFFPHFDPRLMQLLLVGTLPKILLLKIGHPPTLSGKIRQFHTTGGLVFHVERLLVLDIGTQWVRPIFRCLFLTRGSSPTHSGPLSHPV